MFVRIIFHKVKGPRPLSLTTGLVARIWCFHHCNGHQSVLDSKPHSKPLQAEATEDENKVGLLLLVVVGRGRGKDTHHEKP